MSSEIIKHIAQQDCEHSSSQSFNTLLADVRQIIKEGMHKAYQGVDAVMVRTYWLIGQRIVEDEQNGEARAEFGAKLLDHLAEELSLEYASSYSARDLRNYRQLYLSFKDLEIWHARVPNLKWTHFRSLLRVTDENAREIERQKEIYRLKDFKR